jgi:hypothetical protein
MGPEPGGLLDEFGRALAERNRLAHRFLFEQDEDFASFTGREAMLAELMTAEAVFEEVNDRLTGRVKRTQRRRPPPRRTSSLRQIDGYPLIHVRTARAMSSAREVLGLLTCDERLEYIAQSFATTPAPHVR